MWSIENFPFQIRNETKNACYEAWTMNPKKRSLQRKKTKCFQLGTLVFRILMFKETEMLETVHKHANQPTTGPWYLQSWCGYCFPLSENSREESLEVTWRVLDDLENHREASSIMCSPIYPFLHCFQINCFCLKPAKMCHRWHMAMWTWNLQWTTDQIQIINTFSKFKYNTKICFSIVTIRK